MGCCWFEREGGDEQLQDVDIADACCGGEVIHGYARAEGAVVAGWEGSSKRREADCGGGGDGLEAWHGEVVRRYCYG